MELADVAGKAPQNRPQRVRCRRIKPGVIHQLPHPRHAVAKGGGRLQTKPGIEDDGLLLPAVVEGLQGRVALSAVDGLQRPQTSPRESHRRP